MNFSHSARPSKWMRARATNGTKTAATLIFFFAVAVVLIAVAFIHLSQKRDVIQQAYDAGRDAESERQWFEAMKALYNCEILTVSRTTINGDQEIVQLLPLECDSGVATIHPSPQECEEQCSSECCYNLCRMSSCFDGSGWVNGEPMFDCVFEPSFTNGR